MKERFTIFGFTLIEMITVIAIICIIAAILFPVFRGNTRGAAGRLADSIIIAATEARNLAMRERRIVKMYIPCDGDMGEEYNADEIFDDDSVFSDRRNDYYLASTRLAFAERAERNIKMVKWAQPAWSKPVDGAKVVLMTDDDTKLPNPLGTWPVSGITNMSGVKGGRYAFSPYGGLLFPDGSKRTTAGFDTYIVVAPCVNNGSSLTYKGALANGRQVDFEIVKINCLTGEATRYVKR